MLAELKELNFEKTWKGSKALKLLLNEIVDVEVYKIDKDELEYTIQVNPDNSITELIEFENIEDKTVISRFERILDLLEGVEIKYMEDLEDYIKKELNDFSGIVYGYDENYYAEVYISDGKIVGARVLDGNDEFKGSMAL